MSSTSNTPDTSFWDRAAEKYAQRPVADVPAYERTLERTRAHLRSGDEVLEIGCGTGTTALKLADAAGSILATDLAPEMIRIAARKGVEAGARNVSFRAATVFDPEFAPQSFDAVLAFNLLHLVEDAPLALERVGALLKPGGLFISKTPCLAGRAWIFGPVIWILRRLGRAPKVMFIAEDALDRMIREQGFEIVETGRYPASTPSRFVVARKL